MLCFGLTGRGELEASTVEQPSLTEGQEADGRSSLLIGQTERLG